MPTVTPRTPPSQPLATLRGGLDLHIGPLATGYMALGETALTRWTADPTLDRDGHCCYLRDADNGAFWPIAGWRSRGDPGGEYAAEIQGGVARFRRGTAGIEARLEVAPAVERPVELRLLTLHNHDARPRRLALVTCLEPVLLQRIGDLVHPAFSKLFIQTFWDGERDLLLARRRPRATAETAPWLGLRLLGAVVEGCETDRKAFLGRGRGLDEPLALASGGGLSGTTGNVLDPILCLGTTLQLEPGQSLTLATLVAHGTSPAAIHADCAAWPDPTAVAESLAALRRSDSIAVSNSFAPRSARLPPRAAAPLRAAMPPVGDDLIAWNGYGGFGPDGREYRIRLEHEAGGLRLPPMPWSNVIANQRFGCIVSETGAGCIWARNSREWRLTPWHNDPVCDPHGEALWLHDRDSGTYWSPLPGPTPGEAGYEAAHGFGYSRFRHEGQGLEQCTTVFVHRDLPVKLVRIELHNPATLPRRLALYSLQRLVLGVLAEHSAPHIHTRWLPEPGLLLAENRQEGPFAGTLAYAALIGPGSGGCSCTGDRAGFYGDAGALDRPQAVAEGLALDGACGSHLDPAFGLCQRFDLEPRGRIELTVLLGEAGDAAEAALRVRQLRAPGAVAAALAEVQDFWRQTFAPVQIQSGEPAIDFLVNGWIPYQILSCRLWARSAFYQSGGAYGYRDQLQDAAALVHLRPDLTRRQLLLHAAHQFVEGDVLHWWHPEPLEVGIRTRFSDDLLWLPYLTAFYVRHTGDLAVLGEPAPFLRARSLAPGEDEAFLHPQVSGESADLYEHCCRALDRSLTLGAHGLPLMGTGDWNDGMNRVGRQGRGESVWVGFFLYRILGDFLPLCETRGDAGRAERYRAHRTTLLEALNDAGWDGAWYRRAFYDDGTPLGSQDSDECRIDALAQAWAVISGAAPPARAAQAMDAVERLLVDNDAGLIRLLTPPFVDTPHDPGYIRGYVAGIRENGGQYTHAALWVVQALAQMGRRERALELLRMLSPVHHAGGPEAVARYQVEPYVIAADVYGSEPHIGRGGWTWYTGSAGWFYRVALEWLWPQTDPTDQRR